MSVELYVERARHWEAEAERLGARSRLMSNLRGLSFGTSLIAGVASLAGAPVSVAGSIAGAALLAFLVFIAIHKQVLEALDLSERFQDVNRDARRRLEHEWGSLTDTGEGLAPEDHPYAADLDVFGKASLFQRLSVARTRFGRERLAEMLLIPATLEEARRRQDAVRALASELELRQNFEAHALGVSGSQRKDGQTLRARNAPNPAALLAWGEAEPVLLDDAFTVWGSRIFPPLTLAALVGYLAFDTSGILVGVGLALHALVIVRTLGDTNRIFSSVSSTEGAFLRYGTLLQIIEGLKTEDPLLAAIRARLQTQSSAPSVAMAKFRRLVGWFDLKHNGLVHPFVNLFLLWDVHCAIGLERWQKSVGKKLRFWFEAIGWFEALSSLASYAADEPGTIYPQFIEGEVSYEAKGLAHALLDPKTRVPNDVVLSEAGRAMLITGSNMSGKSTLLRAMGVSAVLALTGAPIPADKLILSRLVVRTSIRVADSLEHGVSHFYAEISKLKMVVDSASQGEPVLFLLDEILHGTNSRERQIGARWVLRELLEKGGIGAISTHDQELCRLSPELMDQVELVHLRENVADGRMTFDYRVYPGPVTSGNALRLMRLVGLDVPLESAVSEAG